MALNPTQKSDLLFKKVIAGKSTSNINKDYFEELVNSTKKILSSSIWNQDNLIPTTNPLPYNTSTDGQFYVDSGDNIIEFIKDLVLEPIPNSTSFYDPTNRLNNIIAYNFGDGSYSYKIKKADNSFIALGENNWIFDNDSGVLTFFDGYPSGVSATVKPKISGWKYVGSIGLSNITASNYIDTNFDDLIILRDTSGLQPGTYYRFQFNTIHNIYNSIDDQINTGPLEILWSMALNNNTLSPLVYSESYPQDIIYLDFDNTLCDDGITLRPGNITFRRDPIKNLETYYDWRAVKFRRFKLGAVNNNIWETGFTYYKNNEVLVPGDGFYGCIKDHTSDTNIADDIAKLYWVKLISFNGDDDAYYAWSSYGVDLGSFVIAADPDDFFDFLTFDNPDAVNITIKSDYEAGIYNNIIFTGTGLVECNYFDSNCFDITFRNGCSYNKFGTRNYRMLFLNDSSFNLFDSNCSHNIIDGSSSNSFKYENTLLTLNTSNNNIFGNSISFTNLNNSNANYLNNNNIRLNLVNCSHNNIGNLCNLSYLKNVTYSSIGSNCSNIESLFGMNQSSICSGTVDKTFEGALNNVSILNTSNTVTNITESYSKIVVDMVDPDGNLWYKTIDTEGRISTGQFI